MHTRVKICGLTNAEDAHLAIAAGADALGFNTWPGSKRYLDLAANRAWLEALPPLVTRVALLVNATLEEARKIAALPYIDALQLHGDEDAAYVAALRATGRLIIKAFPAKGVEILEEIPQHPAQGFLLDAHVPGLYGGTGVAVDLGIAGAFRARFPHLPLLLAGGLKPENVRRAVELVRPYAVDVSSGVERSPGVKDPAAMAAFVAEAQAGGMGAAV